jgi:membrane-associated phospholipid phosphatase
MAPSRWPLLGIPALTFFGALLAVLQMVLVIVLRAHWTLDVLAGLFAALMVGAVFWPGYRQWRLRLLCRLWCRDRHQASGSAANGDALHRLQDA